MPQKERIIFQPSIFRCYLLVSGMVYIPRRRGAGGMVSDFRYCQPKSCCSVQLAARRIIPTTRTTQKQKWDPVYHSLTKGWLLVALISKLRFQNGRSQNLWISVAKYHFLNQPLVDCFLFQGGSQHLQERKPAGSMGPWTWGDTTSSVDSAPPWSAVGPSVGLLCYETLGKAIRSLVKTTGVDPWKWS